jgi:hypothetical protein
MAGIKAADLQYVLNTIPMAQYFKAFGLDVTFLNLMGGLRPGPARIQIPIHYAGNATAASFAESGSLATAGKQSRRMVELGWKRVYATLSVDGLQEAIAAAGGVVNINNLVQTEAMQAIQDLLDEINTQMLSDGTGNSSADIDGIWYHIDDDNTWCSLARGSYSWLQSYFADNSGTDRDLTEALMRGVHNTLIDTRKSNYSHILTSSTVADAYEALMGDRVRMVNVPVGDITLPALAFKGRPVIPIPGFETNSMAFIDRNLWEAVYLPQVSTDQYGRKVEGPFKVEPYYPGTDDRTLILIAYVQLVCKNPWKQAALVDVQ